MSEPKDNLGLLELLIQHGRGPQLRGGNAAARSLNLLGKNPEGGEGGVRASRAALWCMGQARLLPSAFCWIVHLKTWCFAYLHLLITHMMVLQPALAHLWHLMSLNIDRWIVVSCYSVKAGSIMLSWLKERGSPAKSISSWILNVEVPSYYLRDIFL